MFKNIKAPIKQAISFSFILFLAVLRQKNEESETAQQKKKWSVLRASERIWRKHKSEWWWQTGSISRSSNSGIQRPRSFFHFFKYQNNINLNTANAQLFSFFAGQNYFDPFSNKKKKEGDSATVAKSICFYLFKANWVTEGGEKRDWMDIGISFFSRFCFKFVKKNENKGLQFLSFLKGKSRSLCGPHRNSIHCCITTTK